MYKKITHNIVEEHFAHPLAADLKKKIDKSKMSRESATKIQIDARRLISNLFWGIRRYMIDALGTHDEATAAVKAKLLTDILEFVPVFAGHFPVTVSSDVVRHLVNFVNSFADIVASAKSGKDTTALVALAQTHLDQLAQVLGTANPTHWPVATVKVYLKEYLTLVATQLTSRIKKDWKADMDAESYALNMMLNGPIMRDGPLKNWPDFASVLATGLATT